MFLTNIRPDKDSKTLGFRHRVNSALLDVDTTDTGHRRNENSPVPPQKHLRIQNLSSVVLAPGILSLDYNP